MRLLRSKKGIQPLVATFLLILIAGSLGIVVMNFGRAQIEVAAQCGVQIGLETVMIDAVEQVCYDGEKNNLFFIVENGPNVDVASLRIRAIGEQSVLTLELDDSSIAKNDALLYNQPYNLNKYGAIRQLRFTPLIQLYQDKISCNEQALTIETVRDC